jgi:DEAD/DEAH box helicase domain-containing protein
MTENVVIIDITDGRNAVIGEMDRPSAKELIFKNAVYIHRGRQYLVEDLNIDEKKCLVREADVNYYTDGYVKTDIKVLTEDEEFVYKGNREGEREREEAGKNGDFAAKGVLGDVLVRSQAAKFKKIKFSTLENIGYGNIDMPEEEMQTRGLCLLFPKESAGGQILAKIDEAEAGSVLSSTGRLIKQIAPMFLLCDSRDIGIAERVRDPHFGAPALFVYDRYPGGTGLAEALSACGESLFRAILGVVQDCPCKSGCPSCVGPGENKAGTLEFLRALTQG